MTTAVREPCRNSRCVSALFRRPTGLADGLALKELALPPTRERTRPITDNQRFPRSPWCGQEDSANLRSSGSIDPRSGAFAARPVVALGVAVSRFRLAVPRG